MSVYNLNPRRVVWFSPNEPSNKYDIWLSRNAHLDENGEPTTDSNSQRDCDYIFKIYDCGKWNPIVGFNTTAVNKINIVKGSPAYTGLDGYSHTDFQEFHLPLFRDPSCSPDELFDAGTVGTVIKEYVNSAEWYDIIHEGGLGLQIEQYYNDNPFELPPAGINLGGILMNRFSAADLTPASTDTNTSILALAKYSTTYNDYHPYVNVKDIISIINTGSAGEISFGVIGSGGSGGSGSSIDQLLLYNSFRHSRSIKRDWGEDQPQAVALKPHFSIWGANNVQNAGKLLRIRSDYELWEQHNTGLYSESNNALDWVDPLELFDEYLYELPLASISALGGIRADRHTGLLPGKYVAECKLYNSNYVVQSWRSLALCVDVRDVKEALDDWYGNNESTALDIDVYAIKGVDVTKAALMPRGQGEQIIRYTYQLNNYPNKDGLFPRSTTLGLPTVYGDTHGLEWVSLSLDLMDDINFSSLSNGDVLIYNNGQWTNGQSGGGGAVYSVFSQNHDGLVPGPTNASNKLYLNAAGQWTTPPDTNTTYPVFTGATALANGTTGLVPQPLAGDKDKFLCADGTWDVPQGRSFDIAMSTPVTHDDNYILDNLTLTTDSAYEPLSKLLAERNYYEITTSTKTTTFTFVRTHTSGNAIYIRVNTDVSAVEVISDVPIINSNNVFGATRNTLGADSSFLFTIQFGIIKIEKLQDISTTSSAEEE